ncbi:cyclopropane fatty acyl phospholipid synthase [Patescibacteria group bacterium]|nr:cyclopropane fatty acyl phospholipid synthase [Patescibacteria group bacterium]
MRKKTDQLSKELLCRAGITVDGPSKWDMQVHNTDTYQRILSHGNLGLGESYMDGWWDSEAIDEMIAKIISAKLDKEVKVTPGLILEYLKARVVNLQNKNRAFLIGEKHYDVGNDLYKTMLDKRMVYTCAYFKDVDDLDLAQEAKLNLVCRKIGLKENDKVLDIGCGFGSFAEYAARHYGAKVVGITVSKEQAKLAKKYTSGLPAEIRLQDYRDVNEKFDHIVSLGMIEHVGYRNYRTYMELAHKCLNDSGLFLIQTIGSLETSKATDRWIEKYIFPNSLLPSLDYLAKSTEGLFVLEDLHNFGADYDKTLMAWYQNFTNGWNNIANQYDQRFYRMWEYYLLSCAGTFRSRSNQLWQIVLSKNGVPGGYISVR